MNAVLTKPQTETRPRTTPAWLNFNYAYGGAPVKSYARAFGDIPFPKSMLDVLRQDSQWVTIPEEIAEIYARWRPTPLRRAVAWEREIGSRRPVYVKDEGASLLGSYKLNTAFPHAYYARQDGKEGIVGETLAGHWGLSLAFACRTFGLRCCIVIHSEILDHKQGFRRLIEQLGAEVRVCDRDGDPLERSREDAFAIADRRDWAYAVGCSFDHVLSHQSVIGIELCEQAEKLGVDVSAVVSCCGSGSNLGGTCLPVIHDRKAKGRELPQIVAAVTDPQDQPRQIAAKGLTGHNLSPIIQREFDAGAIEIRHIRAADAAEAGVRFFRSEGLKLAPESSYAVAGAEQLALEEPSSSGEAVVVCLSGRGYWD